MAAIETWFTQDLTNAVQVQYLDGNVFSQDNQGNKIGVCVTKNGEPYALSGSVSGSVIRADGATVAVSGTCSENTAYIVLPAAAYYVPGIISVVIKLTTSGVITTLCAVVANVYQSATDATVDPGTIIPSISTLIAQIDAAIATIPADYSALWASVAPVFSASKSGGYKAGEYVTYDGGLYRFDVAHTGSWAAADVTAVSIGTELYNTNGRVDFVSGHLGEPVVTGASLPVFSGNNSDTDPLVINISRVYYLSKVLTGNMYQTTSNLANLTKSIGQNEAMYFDYDTATIGVISTSSIDSFPLKNKIILIWKQNRIIKGAWAWMYYATKGSMLSQRDITKRIMNRQGEGYGFPDNSLEAVKRAMWDGNNMIRVAVACTSDNVLYCTHSYELRNNSTLHVLTYASDGTAYNDNVFINEVTSTFIDTLKYKGYVIPRLSAVLAYLSRFDVGVTLELKDRFSATAIQNMINSCGYYNVIPVYSCNDYNGADLLGVSENVDFAIIFEYTTALAAEKYAAYKDHCKSLRFDVYYTDSVPQNDIISYHKLGVKFKVGGNNPTQAQYESFAPWCDVIEVPGEYQTWLNRIIYETW